MKRDIAKVVDPAGLPAGPNELPVELVDTVVELAAKGWAPPAIAKKVHPHNRKLRRRLRLRLWRLGNQPLFQAAVAARAHSILWWDLIGITRSLGTRAIATGKPDAVKLAMEVIGFHTPKQSHEHSGEINIKLDMPRPKSIDADGEEITDAEVVD